MTVIGNSPRKADQLSPPKNGGLNRKPRSRPSKTWGHGGWENPNQKRRAKKPPGNWEIATEGDETSLEEQSWQRSDKTASKREGKSDKRTNNVASVEIRGEISPCRPGLKAQTMGRNKQNPSSTCFGVGNERVATDAPCAARSNPTFVRRRRILHCAVSAPPLRKGDGADAAEWK